MSPSAGTGDIAAVSASRSLNGRRFRRDPVRRTSFLTRTGPSACAPSRDFYAQIAAGGIRITLADGERKVQDVQISR
jgi:hypothetical protein